MSLDKPGKNKIMQAPPAKKGFHFTSDGIHKAMFIEAASIEEAEAIYHKTKEVITEGVTVSPTAPAGPEEKGIQ